MKSISKYAIIFITGILFVSCQESREKARKKLNDLNEQVEQINTKLDSGIKKIETMDSIIGAETKQLKEIDSLIKKTSTKIDSIATEKMEAWKNSAN
ncbi:MAG TPA: hypothetical protein VFM65_11155 [Flavobacteriaceae bacterium]|nr:hypothetical protein [Flavobacteriaceae bacterium]